jgi:hypothetical protein
MVTPIKPALGYVPHFDVTTVDGQRVPYQALWQRRNLLLIIVRPDQRESAVQYASLLAARRDEIEQAETTVVVTTDAVQGLPPPRVVVADQWGEVFYSASPPSADVSQFPPVDELLSWLQFVRMQCPECPP